MAITEKAVSKKQQRFFGMVHALQKGELNTKGMSKRLKKNLQKTAAGISKHEAEKFAKTKHKGLPEKVSETLTFKQFLLLNE